MVQHFHYQLVIVLDHVRQVVIVWLDLLNVHFAMQDVMVQMVFHVMVFVQSDLILYVEMEKHHHVLLVQ